MFFCIPPTQLNLYVKLFDGSFSYFECESDGVGYQPTLKLTPTVNIYTNSFANSHLVNKYYYSSKISYQLNRRITDMGTDFNLPYNSEHQLYFGKGDEEIIKKNNYRLLIRGKGSGLKFKTPTCHFNLLQVLKCKKILITPKDINLLSEMFMDRFELSIITNYNYYNISKITEIQELYYTDSEAMVTEYNLVTRKDDIGRLDGDTVYVLYSKNRLFVYQIFNKKTDKLVAMSYYL